MADYFGPEADVSIKFFLNTVDPEEKNRIFDTEIRPVFEKLIHSLIYVYRFQGLDEIQTLKDECLAHLYENVRKFKPDLGTKAFSYFNVVARNWFINRSKEIKKRERNESDLPIGLDHEQFKNDSTNGNSSNFEDDVIEKEFWVKFSKALEEWQDNPEIKPQEKKILDTIIFLFQNADLISVYNRKAINIYIRELTNLSNKQVAASLQRLKTMYLSFKDKYDNENPD